MNLESQTQASEPNTGQGRLIIHVTTARGAIPLEGAKVNIRNNLPDSAPAKGDVIASVVSDPDGNTAPFLLSTPSRSQSQQPTDKGIKPYSTYNVEVVLEGFYTQYYYNIPIFDQITAIQPVDMIPLPENEMTDSRTPDGDRFFESTAPEL